MEKYRIVFTKKTLIITKDFEDKMQNTNSEEYKFYKQILADIPGIIVLRRTHKTPTKYINKNNEEFRCNQFNNLKFKNMERFISALPRSDEYIAQYNFIKDYAGSIQINKYKLVREWFIAQFPEYRNNPLFYLHNEPKVLSAEEFAEKIKKQAEEKTELPDAV